MRRAGHARAVSLAMPRARAVPGTWGPVVAMTLATALAAQVVLRLPFGPVPFTMQVFAVVLTGLLLEPGRAAAAQVAYVGLGAAGVPWFAGLMPLVASGPTLGYLAGFVVAAPLIAALRGRLGPVAAGGLGIAGIHGLGLLHLSHLPGMDASTAALLGVVPFLPGDVLKLGLAVAAARRLGVQAGPSRWRHPCPES